MRAYRRHAVGHRTQIPGVGIASGAGMSVGPGRVFAVRVEAQQIEHLNCGIGRHLVTQGLNLTGTAVKTGHGASFTARLD
tara:strand:- start:1814 stop:2053 length:240 start_codon:yes stop_codon:yes gene_type:complete